jgi:hypothetical protein
MKTTLEIADGLFDEVKALARTRGVTLRRLVEESLRSEIARATAPVNRFVLDDGSVDGEGLIEPMNWSQIRSMIYEGSGG